MGPLGILILVEQERHAYAIAGVVSGAYAVGAAVGTPVWGRLMDRFGLVVVLLPTSITSAVLLVALAAVTTQGASDAVLVGIATADTGPRTAMTSAGVGAVLLVMLMLSIGFGQIDTSLAATADLALGGPSTSATRYPYSSAFARCSSEAQAFLSASNTTGAALGTAVWGIVVDVAGLSWSFGGAALGVGSRPLSRS